MTVESACLVFSKGDKFASHLSKGFQLMLVTCASATVAKLHICNDVAVLLVYP